MSYELWHTSAPKGLRGSGFCTVKATRGLPIDIERQLERLSAYSHIFPPDANGNNPVAYNHVLLRHSGSVWHVLSRVCDAGRDYSGRTNKFAHHLVLTPQELPPGGPAWLAMQPGVFERQWDGQVGLLNGARPLPHGDVDPQPCRRWEALAGDAGWAGLLAETALAAKNPTAYIIAAPQMDTLALIAEALALLPPDRRWKVGFTTYFCDQFPPELEVPWKVCIEGTPAAEAAVHRRHCLVINLLAPQPVPEPTPSVVAAREGRMLAPAKPSAAPRPAIAPVSEPQAPIVNDVPRPGSPPPPSFKEPSRPPARHTAVEAPMSITPTPVTRERRSSAWSLVLMVAGFLLVLGVGMALGVAFSGAPFLLAAGGGKDTPAAATRREPGPGNDQPAKSPTNTEATTGNSETSEEASPRNESQTQGDSAPPTSHDPEQPTPHDPDPGEQRAGEGGENAAPPSQEGPPGDNSGKQKSSNPKGSKPVPPVDQGETAGNTPREGLPDENRKPPAEQPNDPPRRSSGPILVDLNKRVVWRQLVTSSAQHRVFELISADGGTKGGNGPETGDLVRLGDGQYAIFCQSDAFPKPSDAFSKQVVTLRKEDKSNPNQQKIVLEFSFPPDGENVNWTDFESVTVSTLEISPLSGATDSTFRLDAQNGIKLTKGKPGRGSLKPKSNQDGDSLSVTVKMELQGLVLEITVPKKEYEMFRNGTVTLEGSATLEKIKVTVPSGPQGREITEIVTFPEIQFKAE